ncbi:MAG TPA: proton-conducting transporter membrane subunit [Polyangiaceae bacterium]|nr:proton-conducting transporter membrane subunit [Polyangiaceae bacterium]
MSAVIVIVAIGLLGVSGLPGLFFGPRSPVGERVAATLVLAGSILGLGAAFAGMGKTAVFARSWAVPGGDLALRVDGLAAMFLVPLFVVSSLGSIYGLEYWAAREHAADGRKLRAFYGLMSAGIAVVFVAHNAVLFLAGWETMAIAAFMSITTEDEREGVRHSGYVYLVATRVSTLLLFAMFAVLHAKTGSWDFAPPGRPMDSSAATAVFVLGLLGFGIKAGLMPLHVWLPGAHANAPSHVSALMSGVLIKTGIYGIARVCSFLDRPPIGWGVALLLAGSVSGVLGVAFAIGQHDLKRLLAYHSVENIGIIIMGLGVAMLGRATESPTLVTLGVAGGLLHVWNHALFKALLFLSAGAVLHSTEAREIDQLGGLAKTMPRTALAFLFGAVAICGLPPLNGFVSELFVYLGLFHGLRVDSLWILSAIGVPALALIGALALACFVKAYGAVFLGQGRSDRVSHAHDPGLSMLGPMALLGVACTFIGLVPLAVEPVLRSATNSWAPELAPAASPLDVLSPLRLLSAAGGSLLALLAAGAVLVWRAPDPSRGLTWDCGYAAPSRRMQYTSSSFAESLVGFFSWALRPSVHGAAPAGLFPSPTTFHSHVPDTVLDRALIPLSSAGARALRWFRWVQHGNVQLYLVYILATLFVLILMGR